MIKMLILAAAALSLAASCLARANPLPAPPPPREETSGGYLKNFALVPIDVAGGIYRRTARAEPAALLGWAAVAGAFLLDETVRDTWQDHMVSEDGNDASAIFHDSGNTDFIVTGIGAAFAASLLLRSEELAGTTALVAQSFAITHGITALAKLATGRERPRDADGEPGQWQDDGQSFFSGHSSGAWSVATVVAHRYRDNPLVPALAYGWAAGVSVSRINEDAHFLSDVVVGGLLGYLVGSSVVRHNPLGLGGIEIRPMPTPDGVGVEIEKRF